MSAELPGVLEVFDDNVVANIVEAVTAAGWVSWLETETEQRTGRPRDVSMTAWGVGAVLNALHQRAFSHTEIAITLHEKLTPAWRQRLAIVPVTVTPRPGENPAQQRRRERLAATKRIERLFKHIKTRMDPSTLPTGRRLTTDELRAETRHRAPAEIAEHRAALLEFTHRVLLDTTLHYVDDTLRAALTAEIGVDATYIEARARGVTKDAQRCSADPQAGWYRREGDHNGNTDDTDARRRRHVKKRDIGKYGYEINAVTGRKVRLALGFTVDRPGVDPAGNAVAALTQVKDRLPGPFWLAGDRVYSNTLGETFQLPARALGAKLVLDYKKTELGVGGSYAGAVFIEGNLYCPAIHERPDLIAASSDYLAGTITEDTYRARINARADFLLLANGIEENRWQCPVTRGKGVCVRQPESLKGKPGRTRIPVTATTPHDRICTAKQGVRIPLKVFAKHHQTLQYASEEWAAKYAHLRNSTEGAHSFWKNPNYAGIEQAEKRPMHGIATTTIACAFTLLASNIRALQGHAAAPADHEDQLENRRRQTRARRAKLEDYRPRRITAAHIA